MLSSPVILYDHPEIAPESAGDLFDATEIDEILTLRTMALTESEKREARATDPRAAELMDRMDHIPPEMLERMHGAIRYLRPVAGRGHRRPAVGRPPAMAGAADRDGPAWPPADGVPTWPARCPRGQQRTRRRRSRTGRRCRGGIRALTAPSRPRPTMSSWPGSGSPGAAAS